MTPLAAKKPCLVFVHGFLGGSRQWREQQKALSRAFRIIAPDLPGFGDNAHLPPLPSIAQNAAAVLRRLDDSGVGRFMLLGHSMGGMVAQEITRQSPGRVAGLILYGTGADGTMPGRFESIAQTRARVMREGVQTSAEHIAATWLLLGRQSPRFAEVAAIAHRASQAAHIAALSAMEKWSGADFLAHIRAPTLVVWGACDRSYLFSQTEKLWREIAGADLAVIPGAAHMAHLDKPALFNLILGDFLFAIARNAAK